MSDNFYKELFKTVISVSLYPDFKRKKKVVLTFFCNFQSQLYPIHKDWLVYNKHDKVHKKKKIAFQVLFEMFMQLLNLTLTKLKEKKKIWIIKQCITVY